MAVDNIRNFCIIAHIDHGKSTLADRILQATGAVSEREFRDQFLDQMDLERERGITIKLQAVRLRYRGEDGREFILNLIDTPGHVDFSYEVSRSMAACEGALLVVDAVQGVEAQTVANMYLALENDLELIPVINKIDLPDAEPERVKGELANLGLNPDEAILCSARTGEGMGDILDAIVNRVPPPDGDAQQPLQALIFDSHYDSYRGAVAYVRVVSGTLRVGNEILMMSTGQRFEVSDLGVFAPQMQLVSELCAGEVGCVIASMKGTDDTQVGDTITNAHCPASEPLPGYQEARPMVFCGLYPVVNEDFDSLKEALQRLHLNDSSLSFEQETSPALGFGYRCGFLGLLHMEIVQERLEREFGLDLVTTAPSVVYRVTTAGGDVLEVENPSRFPDLPAIAQIEEPVVRATLLTTDDFVGPVMELCEEKRGQYVALRYMNPERVMIEYELPLSEILTDFYDRLKSVSRGYASLDYEMTGYRQSDLVKMDILINGDPVDALSAIVHRDKAEKRGRRLAQKLKEVIPRQMFQVVIQAAIGRKIIARETIPALRKDVLAKCYGGDVTRKRKLLERQKEGKKRMKQVGSVEVPQEAFMAVLELD